MPAPNSGQSASIRAVQPQDWPTVCEVTLQMLADAPHAFGETLAEAEARTTLEWQQWVEQLADTVHAGAYVAEDALGVCGFVRGDTTNPQLPPGAALAGQLWVAPRQRGTGLGRRLMEAVTQWASDWGAEQVVLGVMETNLSVIAFYEYLGYSDTGMRVQMPGDRPSGGAPKTIIVMGRRLRA